MSTPDDPDREAILARRETFISRALAPYDRSPLAGRRTKLAALAISGLTTACPCLKVHVPDEETGEETIETSEETNETETGGTETDSTG